MDKFKKDIQGLNVESFNVSGGGNGARSYGRVLNCYGSQNCFSGGGGGAQNCQQSQNCFQQGGGVPSPQVCYTCHPGACSGGGGGVQNCQQSQNCFQQGSGGGAQNCLQSENCFQQGGWSPCYRGVQEKIKNNFLRCRSYHPH